MIKVFLNSMVETDTFSQELINCSIRYDKWSHGTLGLNMAHAVCWHYHTTVLHHGRSLSAHKSETKGKNLWANSLKKSLVQKGHAVIKETHRLLFSQCETSVISPNNFYALCIIKDFQNTKRHQLSTLSMSRIFTLTYVAQRTRILRVLLMVQRDLVEDSPFM